jgi:hypothetical protein
MRRYVLQFRGSGKPHAKVVDEHLRSCGLIPVDVSTRMILVDAKRPYLRQVMEALDGWVILDAEVKQPGDGIQVECALCDEIAEYYIPRPFCTEHWVRWWCRDERLSEEDQETLVQETLVETREILEELRRGDDASEP